VRMHVVAVMRTKNVVRCAHYPPLHAMPDVIVLRVGMNHRHPVRRRQ